MADSHGNLAANTQEISVEAPRISALQQEGIASDSLVEYLKVNKSKFSWAGTFTELIEFTNKYLHHKVKYDRPGECSPEKDCLR